MEFVIGILGLVAAIVTLKLSFFSKPKEELENLKVQFKATQAISLDVQEQVKNIATTNDCWDNLLFPGITFRAYLMQMQISFNENLSDNVYLTFDNMELTKSNISSMLQSIEKQQGALLEIQASLKLIVIS